MKYFVGIDLGTSGAKSLLMGENGEVLGSARKGYPILKPRQDWAEQDIEVLWEAVKETIMELMARFPEEKGNICGVGYSGQMHGLVMVDAAGKPVRNAIIWADQRSGKEIEKIYRLIPKEGYSKITRNAVSTGFLAASLLWVKEHEPENYEKVCRVFLPKDYIRYKMCGEFGTDMTDASSTLLFDTARREWAWELIDALDLDRGFFVPCGETCEAAGCISRECARETGLPLHVKVVYGGGDSLMQALGNGMSGPGILSSNIGTASQLASVMKAPFYDEKLRTNTFCHVRKDLWMLMGANLSGGVALDWLKDKVLGLSSFEEMMEAAAEAPAGSSGMLFLPYLSGERTPYQDPNAKGIYFGLTLKHTKAHFVRSTMEGIVFALKNSLEIFEELGVPAEKIIASGGGARSQLFRQIQADIFGKEIYTNRIEEQACVGAAIAAAVGNGTYQSLEEACGEIVRFRDEITVPEKENQKIYEERYQIFKELYPRNRTLFSN